MLFGEIRQESPFSQQGFLFWIARTEVEVLPKPGAAVSEIQQWTRYRASIRSAGMLQAKIPKYDRALAYHRLDTALVYTIWVVMGAEPQCCCAMNVVHFDKRDPDGNGCRR